MKNVITIIAFFILAQLIGMFTGIVIIIDFNNNPYVSSLAMSGNSTDPTNAVFFLTYVLGGAVLMILLIRFFKKQEFLFRFLEFILISTSSSIVFYSFLRFVMGYDFSMLGCIALGLIFALIRVLRPE